MKQLKNSLSIMLLACVFMACKEPVNRKGTRVSTLPYYNEASFTPHWNLSDKELINFHKVAPFSFINHKGNTITEASLENTIYVADFFFTTCQGICPRMQSNMLLVQEAFKLEKDVAILSHSVTPSTDTVEMLNDYAESHDVEANNWYLLTGDREAIYNLGRKSYFVDEDLGAYKGEQDFLHTENFVLIDKNKHIRGIYNGLNKTAVRQLIDDIKTLKKEAI
ncbi:SCO family protein [Flavobacteriaceae bacterium]|nr:SCO family protein [Flavobacteriaceae bacterium]